MPADLISFISVYGYLAIFFLIFIQEIGVPNPVPNELVLIFSGYLTFKGILFMPFVILSALSADFIGTNILYVVFYYFGKYILENKPRWIPLSKKTIDKLNFRISKKGTWAIFLGRLTPFIRGYTSVISGFLQIKPAIFLPIAITTALLWSSTCVICGRLLGPYWMYAETKLGLIKLIFFLVILVLVILFFIRFYRKKSNLSA